MSRERLEALAESCPWQWAVTAERNMYGVPCLVPNREGVLKYLRDHLQRTPKEEEIQGFMEVVEQRISLVNSREGNYRAEV